MSSLYSPWKTSQALRTQCRTNGHGMGTSRHFVFFLGWTGGGGQQLFKSCTSCLWFMGAGKPEVGVPPPTPLPNSEATECPSP